MTSKELASAVWAPTFVVQIAIRHATTRVSATRAGDRSGPMQRNALSMSAAVNMAFAERRPTFAEAPWFHRRNAARTNAHPTSER